MTHPRMKGRARLRTAVPLASGTLLAAAALALAAVQAGGVRGVIVGIGALGLLFFAAGAARVAPELLNWGIGLILAVLVTAIAFSAGPVRPLVLVEAACLYAAAELGWLAAVPPQVVTAPTLLLRGVIMLSGLAVGYLALFGLALPYAGGPVITVIGVAAAVLVFFLLRGRRPRSGRRRAAGR